MKKLLATGALLLALSTANVARADSQPAATSEVATATQPAKPTLEVVAGAKALLPEKQGVVNGEGGYWQSPGGTCYWKWWLPWFLSNSRC